MQKDSFITYIVIFAVVIVLAFLLKKLYDVYKRNLYLKSDIGKIDMMSGAEFEEYLYEKFCSYGIEVEHTPLTKDFGADLIVTLEDGYRIAIQAKRYDEKVGLSAVQEVVAALAYYECDRGMVITNSEYTDNTRILAEVNNVILWDRELLVRFFIEGLYKIEQMF